jgi:hypothetical protein
MNEPNLNPSPEDQNNAVTVQPVDPLKKQMLLEQIRDNQQLTRSIVFGSLAAIAGALIWALISVFVNRQIGWMAVGLGLGIGYVFRMTGQGIDKIFGYWSAGLSLFGCIFGNILIIVIEVSKSAGAPFMTILTTLMSQPQLLFEVLKETFHPVDLLFYGLAVYYGYKFAFRTLTPDELKLLS